MEHRRHWFGPLAALLVLVLILGAGSAMTRNAWSDGYMMGQLAAGNDGSMVMPYPPNFAHRGFGGIGPIFGILLVFGLFTVFGGRFRRHHWRMAGGRGPKDREEMRKWCEAKAKRWHEHHDQMPPWWHDEGPKEKTKEEPAAPTETTDEEK